MPSSSFARRLLCQSVVIASVLGTASTVAAQTIAITDARLIDGLGNEPVYPATLIIQDGRIAAVGAADQISIPPGHNSMPLAARP